MKKIAFVLFLALSLAMWAQEDFWQPADELWGGRIDGIAAHAGKLFAIRSSHVYLSTDGGDAWTSTGGTGVFNINCLAVNPSGHLYLGVTHRGVWWTANNGNTWSNNQITHDPHTGLGASISAIGINSLGHIYTPKYRSFDGGNSWQEIDPPALVTAFAFGSQNEIFAGTYGGIYLSTNSGGNWTARNTGIENIHIISLAIDSNGDLYAGSLEDGIFHSSDAGLAWAGRNSGLGSLHITSVKIAPNGDIYAATQDHGIYRSTDQGLNWTSANGNLTDLHVQTIAAGANSELYIGTRAGGIFKSTDNGSSWTAKNQNIEVPHLNAAIMTGANDLLLGTWGSGVFHSPDGHAGWSGRNNGLANLYVSDFASGNSGQIIAGTLQGVFRSSDVGENWLPANTGIENEIIAQVASAPSGRLYALTNAQSGALFYSDDNGNSWDSISTGINDVIIRSMAVSSQGDLFLSAFSFFLEGLVLISTDGGATWSDTVLTQFTTSSYLAIDNGDRLYAIFDGDIFFYTDDAGATWNSISPMGLPQNTAVNRFAFDSNNNIYAATQYDGIFYSDDGGSNWAAMNDGLPAINGFYPTFSFLYVNAEDVVYAGTYDQGLFIGGDNPTTIDPHQNVPAQFSLRQNYPNPFNPTTTIGFSIAAPGFVKLTLYDILGKEIATIVNEERAAGDYTVEFNAGKLSSGIYFYQLEAGGFKQTRRMILMR